MDRPAQSNLDTIRRLIKESQQRPSKDDVAVRMLKGFPLGTGRVKK